MKEKVLTTSNSSWPAGVPFFSAVREPRSNTTSFPRQASIGPIELRINGSDGPSAIAILE